MLGVAGLYILNSIGITRSLRQIGFSKQLLYRFYEIYNRVFHYILTSDWIQRTSLMYKSPLFFTRVCFCRTSHLYVCEETSALSSLTDLVTIQISDIFRGLCQKLHLLRLTSLFVIVKMQGQYQYVENSKSEDLYFI